MSQQNRLLKLLKNVNTAIIEVKQNARISYVNKKCEELLGVGKKELLGQYVWEFLKEKKKGFEKILEKLEQNPKGIEEDFVQIVSEKIRSLWVEVCISPFELGKDDTGYLIFLKDVTKKKISEDRVRETTNYLINILNDSADAIMGLTNDSKIFLWNKGAEYIYGYTAKEITGKSIKQLIPEDILKKGEIEFLNKESVNKGFVKNYITDRIRKDGKRITVDITRTAIKDVNGKIIGYSAIVRDITKNLEIQEKLIKSERLSIVGKMAAQVAHEIRNPLSSIMLNLELIEDELEEVNGNAKTEIESHLNTINNEVEHLNNLTDDYLSFVRMPVLNREHVNLYSIVNDVINLMSGMTNSKNIEIHILRKEIPNVYIDKLQIKRACLNIVKNAIEAMDKGGKLKIWCNIVKKRNYISLNFKDSGEGIKKKSLKKITEPFYTTKLTGSGLGMHITSQIMKEHKGFLKIHSVYKKGTIIRLVFPLTGNA
jgi:PAS domain S-box-containing protein